MEIIFILLSQYSSPGEAFFVGCIGALLFSLVVYIVDKAKNSHKDWDDIDKNQK
ncbi:MAG: hypothetical protein MJZ45_02790 [Bacteroidales bacterium]|nr:hypothetical protein [Bacteroidales bacterium]